MAMTIKKFEQLKRQVDAIKSDVSRAEGALAEYMKTLKKDHGCSTLKEAEAKLKVVNAKAKKAQEKFDTVMAAFMDRWGDELGL